MDLECAIRNALQNEDSVFLMTGEHKKVWIWDDGDGGYDYGQFYPVTGVRRVLYVESGTVTMVPVEDAFDVEL